MLADRLWQDAERAKSKTTRVSAEPTKEKPVARSEVAEGTLGEYLIQKGADDQLENLDGMTPYDGIGAGA